jgi:hypothetical protein
MCSLHREFRSVVVGNPARLRIRPDFTSLEPWPQRNRLSTQNLSPISWIGAGIEQPLSQELRGILRMPLLEFSQMNSHRDFCLASTPLQLGVPGGRGQVRIGCFSTSRQWKASYEELIESAIAWRRHSVQITSHLIEAGEVDSVIPFLRTNQADLLVIGLRQQNSHVARLWSTVASLEEKAPCSVLAVLSPA